jgi:hypothetical protein
VFGQKVLWHCGDDIDHRIADGHSVERGGFHDSPTLRGTAVTPDDDVAK